MNIITADINIHRVWNFIIKDERRQIKMLFWNFNIRQVQKGDEGVAVN